MTTDFTAQPHKEAIALIQSKAPVARAVFDAMLPELRGRAFAITGIEAAGVLRNARDAIAGLPAGKPWAEVKEDVLKEISPFFDSDEAADRRADLLIRTHGFQAFNAASYRVAQEDEDTTHLQYLATEDGHARDSHIALNGVILPKDDPFWATHTPPWEWGCRCRIRAINPDLLDEARAEDAGRPPAGKLVIEGPALDQLRNGTLIREGDNGQMGRFDVTPPVQRQTEGTPYQWHPDDLRLPLHSILDRYDAKTGDAFLAYARNTKLAPHATLLDWLEGKALPTGELEHVGKETTAEAAKLPHVSTWQPLPKVESISPEEGRALLDSGLRVQSRAGGEVTLGQVAEKHFKRGDDPARARFVSRAMATARDPAEIWESEGRRYYLARSNASGFVVITGRKGEHLDEVITFFKRDPRKMGVFRSGRLVFQKKTPPEVDQPAALLPSKPSTAPTASK
jgi:SPP1 gp7 family putative phage head morphogenesis protein